MHSSSCVQYTESIPKPEGENTPSGHQKTPAKVSKTGEREWLATFSARRLKGREGG